MYLKNATFILLISFFVQHIMINMPNVQEQDQEIQDSDFQLHRSRGLLRVRSSDLYQNEAVFLYFHLVLLVF